MMDAYRAKRKEKAKHDYGYYLWLYVQAERTGAPMEILIDLAKKVAQANKFTYEEGDKNEKH